MASDLGIIFFDVIRFLVGMSIPIGSLALKNAVMLYLDEVFNLIISSMNIRIVINLVSVFAGYALFLICYPSAASTMPYILGFAMLIVIIAATMIAWVYQSEEG